MAWLNQNLPRAPKEGYAPSSTTDIDGFRTVIVLLVLLSPFAFSALGRYGHLLVERPQPRQPAAAVAFPGTPAERIARVASGHFTEGEEYLRWGDYVSALDKFETVQNIDPRYPRIAERLAEARRGIAGETPPTTLQATAARAAHRQEADRLAERRAVGPVLQDRFAREGNAIQVTVSGTKAETVRLTYVLFDDTWPQRLETDGTLTELCGLGFASIEMVDGFQYRAIRSCS
jgi:hypothetical protein